MAYLTGKLTDQLYTSKNTSFLEKMRFPEVTHYFCFMGSKYTRRQLNVLWKKDFEK